MLQEKGFTLTELLVTVGVLAILMGIGTISFAAIRVRSQVDLVAAEVRSEILRVQSEAFNQIQSGVYFESSRYVYFTGDTYIEGALDNRQTDLPPGVTLSTITLTGNTTTFDNITGYLENFADPAEIVIASHDNSNTVSINQWGTIEIE